ncbi:hypothetical protein [Sphingobacterium sp. UBA6645]|uniref:hypothetical protein n=1 Tax=Sphingobacterium sp. UBA6645 TaxID=1947511 RepID=UPI0025D466F1|nr:hypothetical protein [Sphingobacterium sp. UBA6645]
MTVGIKSGKIFQNTKAFANSAGKLLSKVGAVGTVLSVGVIVYELENKTWDAYTVVNGTLLVGAGVATAFGAPVVLTGIAIYGVGDYFFDFSDKIEKAVGRTSPIWRD